MLYFLASVLVSLKSFCVWSAKEISHFFIFLNQIKYGCCSCSHQTWQVVRSWFGLWEGPLVLHLLQTGFLPKCLCSRKCSSPLYRSLVLGLFWVSQAIAPAPGIPRHRAIPTEKLSLLHLSHHLLQENKTHYLLLYHRCQIQWLTRTWEKASESVFLRRSNSDSYLHLL